MNRLMALALVFGTGVTLTAQAETTRCKAINKLPYQIDTAGVYCLKKNLTATPSPELNNSAITIATTAIGAVLDLNGFVLSGSEVLDTTNAMNGIQVGASDVTIRNGTIRNFGTGIRASSAPSGLLIEGLTLDSNLKQGISLYATRSVIRNNTIVRTGGFTGSANATAYGIEVEMADNMVIDNRIMGVTSVGTGYAMGITTDSSVSRTIVRGNLISSIESPSGSEAGIWFQGGSANIATDNRITAPGNIGIAYGGTGTYMNNLVDGANGSDYNGTGTAAGSTNF